MARDKNIVIPWRADNIPYFTYGWWTKIKQNYRQKQNIKGKIFHFGLYSIMFGMIKTQNYLEYDRN